MDSYLVLSTYIVNTRPVKSSFFRLDWSVAKEVVVLRAPHPEVLHEHDGVAPLLVRVAPEEGGQVGQVDGVLQEMACWSWRSFYVINTTREQEQPPGGIGPNSLLDGLARVSHTIEYFSMYTICKSFFPNEIGKTPGRMLMELF